MNTPHIVVWDTAVRKRAASKDKPTVLYWCTKGHHFGSGAAVVCTGSTPTGTRCQCWCHERQPHE